MSGKLDQSLDEILSTTRRGNGRRGGARGARRVPNASRHAVATPVNGVRKTAKVAPRAGGRGLTSSGPAVSGESKVIVSNLPLDVNEGQIKEYFVKSVGAVKRVTITYGPNGVSRGIATIIFSKAASASDAAVKLNGLLVDKRPMKIEVVLDASKAPPPEPVRGMSDRISQPKGHPKKVTPVKANDGVARGARAARGRGRGGRVGKAGRGKPKTAEELDAEMTDYFVANNTEGGATNGGAAAATNDGEDLGMDEIS